MNLNPVISIVTLGVGDVARASRFYQSLGWRLSAGASTPTISFFALNNIVLGLFNEDSLIADSGLDAADTNKQNPDQSTGIVPPRIVLAQNYPSESAVRQAMDEARAAGGRVLVAPEKTFWGGYHGVFADLDGHVWEIAHNPFCSLASDGSVELPE